MTSDGAFAGRGEVFGRGLVGMINVGGVRDRYFVDHVGGHVPIRLSI